VLVSSVCTFVKLAGDGGRTAGSSNTRSTEQTGSTPSTPFFKLWAGHDCHSERSEESCIGTEDPSLRLRIDTGSHILRRRSATLLRGQTSSARRGTTNVPKFTAIGWVVNRRPISRSIDTRDSPIRWWCEALESPKRLTRHLARKGPTVCYRSLGWHGPVHATLSASSAGASSAERRTWRRCCDRKSSAARCRWPKCNVSARPGLPRLAPYKSVGEWEAAATRLPPGVLDKIVFRGQVRRLAPHAATRRVAG